MFYTMHPVEAKIQRVLMSTDMRLGLYEKIASFLDDGVDLHSVLTKLGEKYNDVKQGDPRAKVLLEWAAAMNEGRSFSGAIAPWVPASESMLIRAGEDSGEVSGSVRSAIFSTQKVRDMKGKLKSELGYPATLLLALFGMLYMIATVVMPELASAAKPETWPTGSQRLWHLSQFVVNYWPHCIAVLVFLVVTISFSMSRVTGGIREFLERIPPWSTYRSVQSSIFLISIAQQMRNGVPIVDAIETMREMSNRYVDWHLGKILLKLNSGIVIGKSLNSGFMDPETGVDIEVFGETSNLQDAMTSIGNRAIQSTEDSIGSMAAAARTICLLLLALFIGWTFTSIQDITKSMAEGMNV